MTKKTGVLSVIVLAGVAAAGIFYFTIYRPLRFFTPDMERAEQALLNDQLLFVASLNVHQLLQLENLWVGSPLKGEVMKFPLPKDSALVKLVEAGIDPRTDVDSIVASLDVGTGDVQSSVILVGRFQVDKVLRALQRSYEVNTEIWEQRQLYSYRETDSVTCTLRPPASFYLSPNFIVLATPDAIRPLIARLLGSQNIVPYLTEWRAYRERKLVAAMGVIPKKPPQASGLLGMLASQAKSESLAVFDKVFIGGEIDMLGRTGSFDLKVEYSDPASARAQVAQWVAGLQDSKNQWHTDLPSFARLHDKIAFANNQNELRARARIDGQAVEDLRQVPVELFSLMFSGLSGGSNQSAGNREDQIQETPVRFEAQMNVASLPDFDPKGTFFGKPLPFVAGPLGLKVRSAKIDEKSESQLIDIQFVGTGIPNVGESKELVQLYFREALDANSQNHLYSKPCGPDRPSEPVYPAWFRTHNNIQSFEGSKSLKLNPGISAGEIAIIKGEAKINVPTVVETRTVNAESGQRIEDKDVSLVVTKVSERSIAYSIYGDASRILLVEGLNVADKPLRQGGSSSAEFIFGEGVTRSIDFRGQVQRIRVTIMRAARVFTVPFEIKSGLPQFDEFTELAYASDADKRMFEAFGEKDFLRRFGNGANRWLPLKPGVDEYLKNRFEKRATSENPNIIVAGPFTMLVEAQEKGSYFSFHIFSNEIPNTAYTRALQIKLQAISTKDGQKFSPPEKTDSDNRDVWVIDQEMNPGSYKITNDKFDFYVGPPREARFYQQLPHNLNPDQVKQLGGVLRLRLLPKLERLTLTDLNPGSVSNQDGEPILKLVEVSDHDFQFHYNGGLGTLVGAQMFDAKGAELRRSNVRPSNDSVSVPRMQGTARIEFYFSREPAYTEYPFEIRF